MVSNGSEGVLTKADLAKQNILAELSRRDALIGGRGLSKSDLGYAAFPDHRFKSPQGAAFSVAKIVHDLVRDSFVTRDHRVGYLITRNGSHHLTTLKAGDVCPVATDRTIVDRAACEKFEVWALANRVEGSGSARDESRNAFMAALHGGVPAAQAAAKAALNDVLDDRVLARANVSHQRWIQKIEEL